MKYDDELTERDLYMYRRGELREYIRVHRISQPDVRRNLFRWVDSGHEVHDNPWGIRSKETGLPCDYLEALAILKADMEWKARVATFRR